MSTQVTKNSGNKVEPKAAKYPPLLLDKVFIVTGGSRGIGGAVVKELVREGAKVAFTYVNSQERSDALMNEHNTDEMKVLGVRADCRNLSDAKDMVVEAVEEFGKLDGLVNCAGITKDKPLMMMQAEEWQDVIDTNLTGIFNSCKASIVTLMKQRKGRIINLSSVSGLMGIAGQVNYSASKAGIIGMTRSLAKEVAPYGITVNALAPGYIETDMTMQLKPDVRESVLNKIPLGRFGTPEELAQFVTFLLSDAAAYITGQVFVSDGGLSLG